MRIMGLDYGSKTVGIAVSDPLLVTAQGIETIYRKSEHKLRQTLQRIEVLAAEYGVTEFVLGNPVNMNYTAGERVEQTLAFKEMLERRTDRKVILWDERLTSVEANRVLAEGHVRIEDRKKHVDRIAATLILQGYLDFRKQENI